LAGSSLLQVATHDPAEARRGRNALIVFYAALVLGLPSMIGLSFIPGGRMLAALVAGFMVIAFAGTLLVRRGRVNLGIWVFFSAIVLAECAFPPLTGDSRLTAVYLAVPVAMAGVLLFPRAALILAVVTIAAGAVLTYRYPPTDPPVSSFEIVLAAGLITGFVLATSVLGFRSLRQETERADLAAARLRDTNELLEHRVVERTEQLQAALERQEQLVAELAELSLRDPLTGLYNRRHADNELPRLVAAAERHHQPLALAMADLDHFKAVNDAHSYSTGDEVLRRFARVLTQITRGTDTVIRYGGEEFLIVMPQTGISQAQVLCERLRRAVEAHTWYELDPALHVTVSIGVTDTTTTDGMLALAAGADSALHQAKREGRNRVVVFRGRSGDETVGA
jgi:diguanylate cyclase (GGDEF)-like protein